MRIASNLIATFLESLNSEDFEPPRLKKAEGTMTEADAKKAINETCPWSGKPVHPDALIEHNGHTVGFCSREHRDQFKALDHFSEAAAKERGRG
jgi:hypothetical protein